MAAADFVRRSNENKSSQQSRVDEEGNELDIVVSNEKKIQTLPFPWLFALAFEPDDDEQEIASRVLVLASYSLAVAYSLLARLPTGDDDVLKAEARKTFKMAAVYLCL